MKRIYYAKPSITELEIKYVTDAIKTGWGEHCYDYLKKFEAEFASYLDVKHAMATSSCTGAIHIALSALGIKPGDEIILADINWIATVAPITYLGAKPVFVDVLPDTWCIDPAKAERAITPKTKAIIATHVYGNLAEMDELLVIAKKHNLYLIEDAAEALGSEYKGKKAGSIGHFGVFSFHGTKTISTGEGGMLVSNDEALMSKARIFSDHGRNPTEKRMFFPERIGFKYKMSNLQAAMGLAQIERAEELVEKKRAIFRGYYKRLGHVEGLSFNPEKKDTKNSYWMPTVIFDESLHFNREKFLELCKENNVDARTFFYPLSSLPMFKEQKENTVSYSIAYRGLNLPTYFEITDEEIQFVSDLLLRFLKQ